MVTDDAPDIDPDAELEIPDELLDQDLGVTSWIDTDQALRGVADVVAFIRHHAPIGIQILDVHLNVEANRVEIRLVPDTGIKQASQMARAFAFTNPPDISRNNTTGRVERQWSGPWKLVYATCTALVLTYEQEEA